MEVECSLTQEHILRSPSLLMSDEATSYLIYRFDVRPDLSVLRTALDAIVRRHEVLRMRYPRSLAPRRADLLPADVGWPTETWTVEHDATASCAEGLRDMLHDRAFTRDDLEQGPPIRAALTGCAHGAVHLVVAIHALAWDGYSTTVFIRELVQLYAAGVDGRPGLPPVETGYLELSRQEREAIAGAEGSDRLDYWKRQYDRYGPTPVLEFGSLVPPSGRAPTITVEHSLTVEETERFRDWCRRSRTTSFVGLTSALLLAVRRLSRSDLVGAKVSEAGRNSAEAHGVIGPMSSGLPIWVALGGDDRLSSAITPVRAAIVEMLANAVPIRSILAHYEDAHRVGTAAFPEPEFARLRGAPALRVAKLVTPPDLLLGAALGVPQPMIAARRTTPGFVVHLRDDPADCALIVRAPSDRYPRELIEQLLAEFASALDEGMKALR
jgi:hypothetical protein